MEKLEKARELMSQCTFESWGVDGTETIDLVGSLNENLQLGDLSSHPSRRLDVYSRKRLNQRLWSEDH